MSEIYINTKAFKRDYKEYQDRFLRKKKIQELRREGMTFNQIAQLLELSRQRVHQIYTQTIKKPTIEKYTYTIVKKEKSIKNYHILLTKTDTWDFFKKLKGRERTRFLVRLRDDFSCQDCGNRITPQQTKKDGRRQHDVHHLNGLCGKKSRSYDRVDSLDGLITLCHRCHFNRPEHATKRGC